MRDEKENKLMIMKGATEIPSDLFGESNVKKMTTLDLKNENDIDLFLNSSNEVDHYLKDVENQVIEVRACAIDEREVESFNDETGENITRKKHVLKLYDVNNETYLTGSNACFQSFMIIVATKGLPTSENVLKLIPVKIASKNNKDHTYLKLKIAK